MRPKLFLLVLSLILAVRPALLSINPYLNARGCPTNLDFSKNCPSISTSSPCQPTSQSGNIYTTINSLLDQYSKLPGNSNPNTNYVSGNSNAVLGVYNGLKGNNNLVAGYFNLIDSGNYNTIIGVQNQARGDNNKIIGQQNQLIGNQNNILGDINGVKGNQNIVF